MSRCEATTQDGERCQNEATEGDYCWIPTHGGSSDSGTRADMAQYDPEVVAKALQNSQSFQEAADKVGCHYSTISRFVDDEEGFEVCRVAWKPTADELTGIGRNGLRYLAVNADDESVRLRACKLLIENYDGEQVPDKTDVTSGGERVEGGSFNLVVEDSVIQPEGGDDGGGD